MTTNKYPIEGSKAFDTKFKNFAKNNFNLDKETQDAAMRLLVCVLESKSDASVVSASSELIELLRMVRCLNRERRENRRVNWTPEEKKLMTALMAEGHDKQKVMADTYKKRSIA